MKTLRAVSCFVIVRGDERQKMTEGGLHLPDDIDKGPRVHEVYPQLGEVVSVGPEVMCCVVGDRVLFDQHEAWPVGDNRMDSKVAPERLFVMKADNVAAVEVEE